MGRKGVDGPTGVAGKRVRTVSNFFRTDTPTLNDRTDFPLEH